MRSVVCSVLCFLVVSAAAAVGDTPSHVFESPDLRIATEGGNVTEIAATKGAVRLARSGETRVAGVSVTDVGIVPELLDLDASPQPDGSLLLTPSLGDLPGKVLEVETVIGPFSLDEVSLLSTAYSGCVLDAKETPNAYHLQEGLPIALFHGPKGGFCVWANDMDDTGKMWAFLTADTVALRLTYRVERLPSGGIAPDRPPKTWRIAAYTGDWRNGADIAIRSLEAEQGFTPMSERTPSWMADLTGVLLLKVSAEPEFLEHEIARLAERINPNKTLAYYASWRADDFDHNYPDYTASDDARRVIGFLLDKGFHVMPHHNSFAVSVDHPGFERYRPYYQLLPGTNEPYLWCDLLAMLNPAFPESRRLLVDTMVRSVRENRLDALYLDFPGTIDQPVAPNGLNVYEGAALYFDEIREALPEVALSSEWQIPSISRQVSFFWTTWMMEAKGAGRAHPIGGYVLGRYRWLIPRFSGPITADGSYGTLLTLAQTAMMRSLPSLYIGPGYDPDHPVVHYTVNAMVQGPNVDENGVPEIPGIVFGKTEAVAPLGLQNWVAQDGERAFGLSPIALYRPNETPPDPDRFTLTRCSSRVVVTGGVDEKRGFARLLATPGIEETAGTTIQTTDGAKVRAVVISDATGTRLAPPNSRRHTVALPATVLHAYSVAELPESGLLLDLPYSVNQNFGGIVGPRESPPHHMGGIEQHEIDGKTQRVVLCHTPLEGQTHIEWLVHLPNNAASLEVAARCRQGAHTRRRFEVWINGEGLWEKTMYYDADKDQIEPLTFDLAPYAGKPTLVTLVVEALGSSSCDWASWVEPSILRR